MLPSCPNALINASEIARLEGGRGRELLVHASMQMSAAYDCVIRNLAKDKSELFAETVRCSIQ
jgi:hypothetical protein